MRRQANTLKAVELKRLHDDCTVRTVAIAHLDGEQVRLLALCPWGERTIAEVVYFGILDDQGRTCFPDDGERFLDALSNSLSGPITWATPVCEITIGRSRAA